MGKLEYQDIPIEAALKEFVINTNNQTINTALPGIIESYDSTTRKATVTPQIIRKYTDGTELEYKPITGVPVVFFGVNNAGIRLPESEYKGQTCLLIFCQRSIDFWLSKNEKTIPGNTNKFDISDAVAIIGLNSFKNTDDGGDDLQIFAHGNEINIKSDGDIEIKGGNTITVKSNGDIEIGSSNLEKLINENFKSVFDNHVHNYTDVSAASGSVIGTTSTPANLTGLLPPPAATLPAVPPTGFNGVEIPANAITSKVSAQ